MKNELSLSVIQSEFQSELGNFGLSTIIYKGRPVWIVKDVGIILGYAHDGRRLINLVSVEWCDEFIQGKHFIILKGKDLADFKRAVSKLNTVNVFGRTSSLMLFYEEGLYLALEKTNKPLGRQLRSYVASDVLPQIARDGAYDPSRQIVNERLVGGRNESAAIARERRLMETEQRRREALELLREKQDLKSKVFKKKTINELHSFLEEEGRVDKAALTSLRIKAAELGLDEDFSNFKPETAPGWLSPTLIGKKLGISANMVGRIISDLGLRGNPRYEKQIWETNPYTNKPVKAYLWSPEAVSLIEEEWRLRNGTPMEGEEYDG